MRRSAFIFLLLLFAMLASLAQAPDRQQTTPKQAPAGNILTATSYIRPTPANYQFPNGQVLYYTADWRLWSAGVASIRIDAVGSEEKVTATADSTGFVSLLYKVTDRFESYFDRKTFCSTHIFKHSEEGLHKRETNIRFDAARHKAVLDEKNLRNNETKHAEEDIPECVTDVLSGIFYLASLPLDQNAVYTFPLNDGGKTVDVRAHVEGKEQVKTGAGTFNTIRVQPESNSGVLKSRGKVWIWYTDDPVHMPVQMRARLFWGTLTFTLARIEHAK
jgi:hypothetical protein